MTIAALRGDRRTFATATAADYSLHMLLGAVSFRAQEFGADQTEMGLVQAAGDAVYMAACLSIGGISERFGRRNCVLAAVAVFVAAGAWASQTGSVVGLVGALAAQRIAAAVFWPTLQGRLADQSSDLGRDAGIFNLSWSVGKTLGYATNALLFGYGLPTTAAFVASACGAVLVAIAMPKDRVSRAVRADGARVDPAEAAVAARRVAVALLGNFAGCAAFTVVMNQAPALMEARGFGRTRGSALVACFVVGQFLAFAASIKRRRHAGTPRALTTATLLVLAGIGGFALSGAMPTLALSCACAGFGAGLAYSQAMLLSLRLPSAATRGAGRHEAVIGAANAATAPLAGRGADMLGRADGALYVTGAIVASIAVAQVVKLAREPKGDA